ncbi:hypothetical protein [Streptomyces sulphureus]|uniref:hypothetical protein n=1 Tax=Streptomyces sulphureus TaxID=47758 RepID=UPI00035F2AB9|nr:hypothetical protein [Streptomyces sulphureus]
MTMIDTWVCVDDEHIYPASLDRSNRWNGWVSPGFTLDAVRQLAAHTEEAAEEYGYDCVDQIKVLDGAPEPVVLHIRWQYLSDEPTTAANVVKPDADGRYWIGGWEWTWYEVEDGPLFYTKKAAYEARKQVLTESARRMGEIMRTQMPDATSCLIDLTSLGHIVRVESRDGDDWPTGTDADAEDGYGPFDTETLGEADEVLRKALDHGRDPINLDVSGWRPARDIGEPELHRVVFAPLGQEAAGDGPLDEARTKATEARRKLLTETVPYLAADCRAACPDVAGVLVDPTAEQPFVMFLVDDPKGVPSIPVPNALAKKVHDRLTEMFVYRPTGADLTACGWAEAAQPHMDGAHVITFPAE